MLVVFMIAELDLSYETDPAQSREAELGFLMVSLASKGGGSTSSQRATTTTTTTTATTAAARQPAKTYLIIERKSGIDITDQTCLKKER